MFFIHNPFSLFIAQELRLQLRFIKAYLFTCKQSVADELRRQVWPKEYLYDDIHLYSLQVSCSVQLAQEPENFRTISLGENRVVESHLLTDLSNYLSTGSNPDLNWKFGTVP